MGPENLLNVDQITSLWGKAQSAGITRRKFLMLMAAGGATAVLAACTKPAPSPSTTPTKPIVSTTSTAPVITSTSTTPTAPSTSATPTTTSKPTPTVNKYGGTFRMTLPDTTTNFGYPLTLVAPGPIFAGFCLEGLISSSNTPLVYAPSLATSWDLAPDKRSYTFYLRKGVKFHDGTDFNAAAVKWNWDIVINAKNVNFAPVASVDIVDDYTVRVNLKDWNILTLDALSRNVAFIISPTAFQKNGGVEWASYNPVGTGPFIFKEFSRSQYVKYAKNPNYWNTGLPYVDAVEVLAIANSATLQAVLLNGDADGTVQTDPQTGRALLDTGKFVAELGAQGNFNLSFNSVDPTSAWSNPNMRAALEYALDKQTISDSLGKGFTHPIWNVIGGISEMPGNNPGTTPRKYDPAKAAQLIKDAGYSNGLKTTMELNARFNNDFVGAVQGYLGKVGITVEVNVLTQAAYTEKQFQPVAPNALRYNRLPGGIFDMVRMVYEQLTTTSLYYPGVKRPEGWDALVDKALHETDPAKVLAYYNQLEQKAYGEVMAVPIFAQQDINVWSKTLRNDQGNTFVRGGNFSSPTVQTAFYAK